MFTIIGIIMLLMGIVLCYYGYIKNKEVKEINKEIEKQNNIIQSRNNQLKIENSTLQQERKSKEDILKNLQDNIKTLETTAKSSYENYCDILQHDYEQKDIEYNGLILRLKEGYDVLQDKYIQMIDNERKELDKIKNTRAAAIEAERKEKEIKNNIADYCVIPTQEELDDINTLERIKPKLNNPRILCMLIWSTYYQKPLTTLCNNILGTAIVTGIYKITNQLTNQVYIGQATDIASR